MPRPLQNTAGVFLLRLLVLHQGRKGVKETQPKWPGCAATVTKPSGSLAPSLWLGFQPVTLHFPPRGGCPVCRGGTGSGSASPRPSPAAGSAQQPGLVHDPRATRAFVGSLSPRGQMQFSPCSLPRPRGDTRGSCWPRCCCCARRKPQAGREASPLCAAPCDPRVAEPGAPANFCLREKPADPAGDFGCANPACPCLLLAAGAPLARSRCGNALG